MDKTVQEQIVAIIREKFEGDILSVETLYDFLTINVRKDNIIDLIRYLYDHPVAKFQYLTTLCAIHYPDNKQIAVMYQLHIPVGKPAPPLPRKPDFFTSSVTWSGVIVFKAFSTAA